MASNYDAWIGREQEHTEQILESIAHSMAATLDLERAPCAGEPLPPGWQWLYFNPADRRSALATDGRTVRGGFLPPMELPRRMWAGSRLQYLSDLPVGATATRCSRIANIANKVGKRGALCFLTFQHTISCSGVPCIIEEQDIVYREAPPPGAAPASAAARPDAPAHWTRNFAPDTTLLFRYSALTFNGHRIHYDQAYVRDVEGYPDLVVHGPLIATLLQQFACEHGAGRSLARCDIRSVSPLFVHRPFRLEGRQSDADTLEVWASGPDGDLAMSATATLR